MAAAVESGLTTHPWRGVYLDSRSDLTTRLRALQASVGREIVACHQTAAQLHGFGVVDDGLLHVTTTDGRSLRRRPGVVLHQAVPRWRLQHHEDILVTDAADAAVDVACAGREIDVLAVLDAALRCGATTSGHLGAAIDRARGRRGIVDVRHWLPHADGLAESGMESRTRFRVLEAGLPPPELQIVVAVAPGGTRRLDLGWRERRIGLEYDGQDFHAGDGSLSRDRRRHNQLTNAGWTIIYATATDIYLDPDPLISALRGLIG
jgi:hypothetical protein